MNKFQIYQDVRGEWRWRLLSGNSRIIADSGEGYRNHADCVSIVEWIKQNAANIPVE